MPALTKTLLTLLFSALCLSAAAQSSGDTLRVLFLGNSYTYGNNLPAICIALADAEGKTLVTDQNTLGGYTLQGHSTNATSLNKIAAGNWDFVVLQEQSQIPTIDFYRYSSMYPAAERLNDSIKKYNPCAKVTFFMTWGRRFGGQQCDQGQVNCSPVFVDFHHMQDSLESAYLGIANQIGALAAPVGIAWGNVLADTNLILHTGDNSHPNFTGSYLAGCTFHAMFWRSSPIGLSYTGSLSPALANYLQIMADSTVFHSDSDWNQGIDDIAAGFSVVTNGDTAAITDSTQAPAGATYIWTFGDGDSAFVAAPTHVYDSAGQFTITLIVSHCGQADTVTQTVTIVQPVGLEPAAYHRLQIGPNPSAGRLHVRWSALEQPETYFRLLDPTGRLIQEFRPEGGETRIDLTLPPLPDGLYFLQAITREASQVRRIILRR